MRQHPVLFISLLLCTVLSFDGVLCAQHLLWDIGKFDQSSGEFNDQIEVSKPEINPVYSVGQSVPSKDWPGRQPGSLNKLFGGRPHPYTILFNLSQLPRAACRLTVSVLLYNNEIKITVPNLAR